MIDLLLVASLIALVLLNALDSAMTRMAVKKGHRELNPFARFLIEKHGVDRGMLYKALLGIPIASVVAIVVIIMNILGIPGIALAATIVSLAGVVIFCLVLLYDSIQLFQGRPREIILGFPKTQVFLDADKSLRVLEKRLGNAVMAERAY